MDMIIENYKGKHCTSEEAEQKTESAEPKEMPDILDVGFYKDKIKAQSAKIAELEKKVAEQADLIERAATTYKKMKERISKLEAALVEATIK